MARIRTIKPEFWTDEKLSECSLSARLLFIGLWTFADDEGRLEFNPKRLQLQLFPCGKVSIADISKWVIELFRQKLICVYEAEDKKILSVPGFCKHQKINRPTPSKLPEYSPETHKPLTEESLTPIPVSGTGTGTVKKKKDTHVQFSKPSLPEVRAYCEEIHSNVNPVQFWNYYEGNGWKVGRNPMKDWKATVRTWNAKE